MKRIIITWIALYAMMGVMAQNPMHFYPEDNANGINVDSHLVIQFDQNIKVGSKGKNYPDAECVLLNCTLDGVPSEGFGPIDDTASTAKLYEFNSHDKNGNTIDVSERNKVVRQLDAVKDAELIGKYSDASWVLNLK